MQAVLPDKQGLANLLLYNEGFMQELHMPLRSPGQTSCSSPHEIIVHLPGPADEVSISTKLF